MGKERQRDLRDQLPGVAGGKALRRLKGREYFVELGKRGEAATRDATGWDTSRSLLGAEVQHYGGSITMSRGLSAHGMAVPSEWFPTGRPSQPSGARDLSMCG
jgi:hypothetical protein